MLNWIRKQIRETAGMTPMASIGYIALDHHWLTAKPVMLKFAQGSKTFPTMFPDFLAYVTYAYCKSVLICEETRAPLVNLPVLMFSGKFRNIRQHKWPVGGHCVWLWQFFLCSLNKRAGSGPVVPFATSIRLSSGIMDDSALHKDTNRSVMINLADDSQFFKWEAKFSCSRGLLVLEIVQWKFL